MSSHLSSLGFLCWISCACAQIITWNTQKDLLPDCNGECSAEWGTWNNWDKCKGGECHLSLGRQRRQRDCHYLYKPPTSPGEEEPPVSTHEWRLKCRDKQEQACADDRTCTGKWAEWEAWTECIIRSGACQASRRRLCIDENRNRTLVSHCFGGFSSDIEIKACANPSCKDTAPVPKPRASMTLVSNTSTPEQNIVLNNPEESSVSKKNKDLGHNSVLIIAVAVGSLVFGAVFVLLLINLVRRATHRQDDNNQRGSRWKRIGSTNTSTSTGYSASYMAASDVMSARTEFIDIRSPSAFTAVSGNSSFASQQHFFGRNDSVAQMSESASQSMLLPVVNKDEVERPRRSRLLQENVYWEISHDTSSPTDGVADLPSENPADDREVVQNVLYGSREEIP